jgi:branched-chain amino acid transport system substrate-binding protein
MTRENTRHLLCAVVAGLMLGCETPPPGDPEGFTILKGTNNTGTSKVRVGLFVPITGGSALAGEQLKSGAVLALEDINYQVGDTNLEVVLIDEASDSAGTGVARDNYADAIKKTDLVAAMLNWHSAVSVQAMEVAAENQMPHLFAFGATNTINENFKANPTKYKVWGAKGWPMPGTYVKGYTDALEGVLKQDNAVITRSKDWNIGSSKKIMLVREAGAWGQSFITGARQIISNPTGYWATNGWTVASEVELGAEAQFEGVAIAAQSAGVALVIGTSTDKNLGKLIQQLKLKVPSAIIAMEGLGWENSTLEGAGTSAKGVLDGGWTPFPDKPAATAFKEKFERRFGIAPSAGSGGLAYDYSRFALKVLARAKEKHGNLTRASILDIYATEVQEGTLTLTGGVLMSEYQYTAASVPDPVYAPTKYYFPVQQYQDVGGAMTGTIVFPKSLAGSNVFQVP